eukprot:scaffold5621_cov105-Pinguiococcus_pyrenoidosus.AAC.1
MPLLHRLSPPPSYPSTVFPLHPTSSIPTRESTDIRELGIGPRDSGIGTRELGLGTRDIRQTAISLASVYVQAQSVPRRVKLYLAAILDRSA